MFLNKHTRGQKTGTTFATLGWRRKKDAVADQRVKRRRRTCHWERMNARQTGTHRWARGSGSVRLKVSSPLARGGKVLWMKYPAPMRTELCGEIARVGAVCALESGLSKT